MKTRIVFISNVLWMSVLICFLAGCSSDNPLGTMDSVPAGSTRLMTLEHFGGEAVPSPLVDAVWGSETLTFWPYTADNFEGIPMDPVNLVFVGNVKPLEIRSALLALDGNRTAALGVPDMFPFNATWSDCIGNVQTGYVEDGGWTGGVIQLQLGDYTVMRTHLRLFETRASSGADGTWTVGAAHFELLVPGTADHQVLTWEYAEKIVRVDLERSGLLDPSSPAVTDVINDTPSYRTIPPLIYNGVPDGLKMILGLPPGPSTTPVGIPTDGKATILCVDGEVAVGDESRSEEFTLQYNQIVPAPFCNKGPLDYLLVTGPLHHAKGLTISSGRFQYSSSITGHLTVAPMNVLQNPPVPAGEPFNVIVSDRQNGIIDSEFYRVTFDSKRVAPRPDGVEKLMTMLHVSSRGENVYQAKTQCLRPE